MVVLLLLTGSLIFILVKVIKGEIKAEKKKITQEDQSIGPSERWKPNRKVEMQLDKEIELNEEHEYQVKSIDSEQRFENDS